MTNFTSISTIGSALPADLLAATVQDSKLPGLRADDYRLELGVTPREAANRSWSVLTGAWRGYRDALARLPESDPAVGLTRDKWLAVVLRELGFGRVPVAPAGGLHADDRRFPISHTYTVAGGHIPVHLLGWGVPLETPTAGLAGAAGRAPHSMVQEYLNRADDALWGILSNGRTFRLLRDSSTLVGRSCVEFDLETMFDGELFSDFVVMFLVCHATRFEPEMRDDATINDCWIEKWRTYAAETGTRALQALNPGVRRAIESLGTGFLRCPGNTLVHRYEAKEINADDVHQSLLRLVYRILFCFVAEDRGQLLDPAATPAIKDRYRQWFSTHRLRRLSMRRRGSSHTDHWQSLSMVLSGLGAENGLPELGLPGVGGLFDLGALDVVADQQISNEYLLTAIRHLTVIQPVDGGPKRTVDYGKLGAEELGSIYEGLLAFIPRLDPISRTFALDNAAGNDRKSTGAYYTPSSLITTLLNATVDPLLDEAELAPDPEAAILNITVCDPACGSGHFLVAAAKRIAARLASVRAMAAGGAEPTPSDDQHAMHDVVDHCIYGVDLNPMAVELAKVSLWLESVQPGRPLSFLSGHLKVGNALLGATPRLIAAGVPDEAFTAIDGDDKKVATARRKQNATERSGQEDLFSSVGISVDNRSLASRAAALDTMPIVSLSDLHVASQRFRELDSSVELRTARLVADAWCAAFVATKVEGAPAITQSTLTRLQSNPPPIVLSESTLDGNDVFGSDEAALVRALSLKYKFFHWHLEFPQIFRVADDVGEDGPGWQGGFSCVLGNPPWETLSPDTREFFGDLVDGIRALPPSEKDAQIDELLQNDSYRRLWEDHQRHLFATAHFLKRSGRYTMFAEGNLGKGDFNVYRMFVETALITAREDGFAAQVTPGNLYGGANASAIRKHLFDRCRLQDVLGLINTRRHWFAEVDIDRFAAYAARIGGVTESFSARFGLDQPSDLAQPPLRVAAALIRAQAPDTYAIPDLRNAFEMTIASKMVLSHPAFGQEGAGPPYRHFQREVDMGNDTGLFTDDPEGLPVYEGRMIDAFDHRAKVYVSGHGNSSKWDELGFDDPNKRIAPQWRVLRSNIPQKLGDRCDRYRLGFGDIANPRNERSFVAGLIPPGTICGHSVPTIIFPDGFEWAYLPWLAVANSFAMDWLTRSRLSSAHLTLTLMDSLPFPRYRIDDPIVGRVAPLVLRLVCTSPEMTDYWNEMSQHGWCDRTSDGGISPSALTDPAARAKARAELDAIVAKLVFGLTRDELSYAIDQFPVLAKRDRQQHGTFRTKDLVLDAYDEA